VTGGSGYLGSHLVNLLLGVGDQVINFDLKNTQNRRIADSENYSYFEGSITSKSRLWTLGDLPKIDGVFHLAALKSVGESNVNPKIYEETNSEKMNSFYFLLFPFLSTSISLHFPLFSL
jgi:UDP-glucose 4-epimerase